MSVTAERWLGMGNLACHGYQQDGSNSPNTEPHALESYRYAHCGHAARQSRRALSPACHNRFRHAGSGTLQGRRLGGIAR